MPDFEAAAAHAAPVVCDSTVASPLPCPAARARLRHRAPLGLQGARRARRPDRRCGVGAGRRALRAAPSERGAGSGWLPHRTWPGCCTAGCATLDVRFARQEATARDLADRLARTRPCRKVRYPGFSFLISFDVADADAAARVERTVTRDRERDQPRRGAHEARVASPLGGRPDPDRPAAPLGRARGRGRPLGRSRAGAQPRLTARAARARLPYGHAVLAEEDRAAEPRPTRSPAATRRCRSIARHLVLDTPIVPPFPDGTERIVVRDGLLLGRRAPVLDGTRHVHDRRRLRRWLHAEPDVPRRRAAAGPGTPRWCSRCSTRRCTSYEEMLRIFWEGHDPTQGMRQGNDVGTQLPLGDLLARRAPARRGRGVTRHVPGGARPRRLREHHDRDRGGRPVLLRRAVPPAVPRREPERLLRARRHRRQLPDRHERRGGPRARRLGLRLGVDCRCVSDRCSLPRARLHAAAQSPSRRAE